MLLSELPLAMLRCLCVTIFTEAIAGYLMGVRTKHGQCIVLLSNVMTNPAVVSLNVLCTFYFGRIGYICSLVVLEIAALTAEATVYRRMPPCKRNPILLSAVLNGSSFLIGLLWNHFLL